MSTPQQPAKPTPPPGAGSAGPIPEDNLPGHHPDVEQDKPTGPPPTPKPRPRPRAEAKKKPPTQYRSEFRWDEPFKVASRVFGVTQENAYVDVSDDQLEIRFGPWHLTTPLANVESAQVIGGFKWWKVIGPAHLSLKDRGITFGTTARQAVCIRFKEPVPGLEPRGVIRHPGATVTVKDPDELARVLNQSAAESQAA